MVIHKPIGIFTASLEKHKNVYTVLSRSTPIQIAWQAGSRIRGDTEGVDMASLKGKQPSSRTILDLIWYCLG